MSSRAGPEFSLGRSLFFSSLIFVVFFGAIEALLRLVGVRLPEQPTIILVDLLKNVDTDISLPFMRADPEVFWSPIPGFKGKFEGKTVTINSLGLRGAEVTLPKPQGRKRLICFGDSITFGYGVGDDETYPFALGRDLKDRGVDVVNAGVTGYTSHQVLGLLRRITPIVDPDIATVLIGWNDGNIRAVDDQEYERRIRRITALEGGILGHIYTYRVMKGLYLRAAVLGGLQRKKGDPRFVNHRASPEEYRHNLERIVEECRARRVRPVFIAFPHRKKKGEAPPKFDYSPILSEAAREQGVPLLDVGDLGLAAPLESNEGYFLDSLHLTPEGNNLMGRLLERQLEALGLI
jgi:lysophospholipase L1-like esterase